MFNHLVRLNPILLQSTASEWHISKSNPQLMHRNKPPSYIFPSHSDVHHIMEKMCLYFHLILTLKHHCSLNFNSISCMMHNLCVLRIVVCITRVCEVLHLYCITCISMVHSNCMKIWTQQPLPAFDFTSYWSQYVIVKHLLHWQHSVSWNNLPFLPPFLPGGPRVARHHAYVYLTTSCS